MPSAVLRAIVLGTVAVGVSGLTLIAYSDDPAQGTTQLLAIAERYVGADQIETAAGALGTETSGGGSAQGVAVASPGRKLFQAKGCGGCHALASVSTSRIGPDLSSLPRAAASRRPGYSAEAYVRESILAPQAFVVSGFGAQMPRLPVTDHEIDILVDFLLGK
jgi:hypothetical protein